MINQTNEQLIREVTAIGNGAHIFAPKEWLGEQIILIRTRKTLKEKIMEVLEPYLEDIEGVYLYGSHARNEATEDSDIDILIISTKKLKIKQQGYEIIALKKDELDKAIKISPLLVYSALKEAKPIINSRLLESLKENYPPSSKDFRDYLNETRNILKINRELLDSETNNLLNPEGIAYSLILRLKGILIIKSLLSNNQYSNKKLFKIASNYSLKEFSKIYESYKATKHNQKLKVTIKKSSLYLLIELLEKEIQEVKHD